MKHAWAAEQTALEEVSALTDQTGTTNRLYVYRLTFSRQEPAIWLGHLDMMRTFERSIRRAGIPIAWSHGYNPRPQMVFALPISVGLAAEADYLDINCESQADTDFIKNNLNQNLPAGLSIGSVTAITPEKASLMSLVKQACYRITAADICVHAKSLLNDDRPLVVEKIRKGKSQQLDLRPLILEWNCTDNSNLDIRVMAGSSQNLRPDLILKLLTERTDINMSAAEDAMITRTSLILAD
jgi:radical SAM-linked protein